MRSSRRQLLKIAGGGIIVGLAGCSTKSGTGPEDTTSTPPTAETATKTETTTTPPTAVQWTAPAAKIGQPALGSSTIYVSGYRKPYEKYSSAPGPTGDVVYGLSPETGEQKWQYKPKDPTYPNPISPPTVHDGTLYIARTDKIVAFDETSHKQQWEANVDAGKYGLATKYYPIVTDDTIYVTSTGTQEWNGPLIALNSDDGSEVWRTDGFEWVTWPPAITDNRIFVKLRWSESDPMELVALDRATGTILWETPIYTYYGAPKIANGRVYVGTSENRDAKNYQLSVFTQSGTKKWSLTTPSRIQTIHPSGKAVYLLCNAGSRGNKIDNVHKVHSTTRSKRWSTTTFLHNEMNVTDETLYVMGWRMRGLDPTTGEVRWTTKPDGNLTSSAYRDGSLYVHANPSQGDPNHSLLYAFSV